MGETSRLLAACKAQSPAFCLACWYLLGQLPPPLLPSLVPALQVTLVLCLESLHSHFQAQLGIFSCRQLILQLCHLRPQVTGCLFCHPTGSLQLVDLWGWGGGRRVSTG